MKQVQIFAHFDWLKKPKLLGELSCETLRGDYKYGFRFAKEWLRSGPTELYGLLASGPGKGPLRQFLDDLPGRWERLLFKKI